MRWCAHNTERPKKNVHDIVSLGIVRIAILLEESHQYFLKCTEYKGINYNNLNGTLSPYLVMDVKPLLEESTKNTHFQLKGIRKMN